MSQLSGRWLRWGPPLVLVFWVAALYGRVLGFPLVSYDDPQYLLQSPHVRDGVTWEGAAWAFTATYFANWHPLTWLSYMLDVELFGRSAGAHHGVNAALHAANAVLLYGLLRRMTGAPWRSALVAALFAVHPLRVESVAWVAERKDVLSAFFALLTLGAYVGYAERPVLGRYGLVALWFSLGLLAKPMLVTLPFVLLLLDYWPLRRREGWRRLALEKLPLLPLAAASIAMTLIAQRQVDGLITLENASLAYRAVNALASYGSYLAQTLVPVGLSPFYPHPRFQGTLPWAAAGAGAAVVAAASAAAWRWRFTRPWFSVGWLWYLGTLVPVIGLVQVGEQARADRYTYLPLVGLFLAAAWGLEEAARPGGRRRTAVVAGATGALAVLSALTWVQVGHWRSTEALFRHALSVNPGDWLAYNNLAADFSRQGRDDEALAHARAALGLNPYLAEGHYNAAVVLERRGRVAEAAAHLRRGLEINPGQAAAHYLLAVILRKGGDDAEAERHFRAALRAAPDDVDVRFGLGALLARRGALEEAVELLGRAATLRPGDADIRYNLGLALNRQGKTAEALEHLVRAAAIKPADPAIQNNLGVTLAELGRLAEAAPRFQEALRLEPKNGEAAANLARLMEAVPMDPWPGRQGGP